MLSGYRDRMTDLLCSELLKYHGGSGSGSGSGACSGGEPCGDAVGAGGVKRKEEKKQVRMVPPVETYLHTYGIIHEHWHIEDCKC